MIYRGGPGGRSAAEIRVDQECRVTLVTGLIDVGEGATTVLAQMAAEVLGMTYQDIRVVSADTGATPPAPITAGSTATFSTGTAVVQAATQVRQELFELASTGLEAPIPKAAFSPDLVGHCVDNYRAAWPLNRWLMKHLG